MQGTQVKDVKIPDDAVKSLLLEKHAEYIAAYGNKKDDYVTNFSINNGYSLKCPSVVDAWTQTSVHILDDCLNSTVCCPQGYIKLGCRESYPKGCREPPPKRIVRIFPWLSLQKTSWFFLEDLSYDLLIYTFAISFKKEYCITEYLRMSGVYWGVTAMDLMRKIDMMNKEEIIEFVKSCQHEDGGFGASLNHDSSLLYTLSAIQVIGFLHKIPLD